MDKDSSLALMTEWLAMSKSGALKDLFDILKKHEEYCKKEALLRLSNGEYRLADRWEAKAEDVYVIETLIRKRVDELKKGE